MPGRLTASPSTRPSPLRWLRCVKVSACGQVLTRRQHPPPSVRRLTQDGIFGLVPGSARDSPATMPVQNDAAVAAPTAPPIDLAAPKSAAPLKRHQRVERLILRTAECTALPARADYDVGAPKKALQPLPDLSRFLPQSWHTCRFGPR
jgi:hypothetical protein